MTEMDNQRSPWQTKLHEIIFEAETPSGKVFDLALLLAIILSVVAVLLESIASLRANHGPTLRAIEWFFTILFSIEYTLRLASAGRPIRYALSFFGLVDLLAIVPTYLSVILPGAQSLIVIRALRLLRVFRVMKLVHFVGEARLLGAALHASSRKIIVFLGTVLTLMLIVGSLMYLIEGEEHGFTNIPESIYWTIVTMTTVGYGDLAPVTVVGRILASIVMIMGYGIIAVPTGIVTVEMASATRRAVSTRACLDCARDGHDSDASHCKYCGGRLRE